MTLEKKHKIAMYRKQAAIAEVRIKSRSREKEFQRRFQSALEQTMVRCLQHSILNLFKHHVYIS